MKISFVIPTYNREDILCKTLDNVLSHVKLFVEKNQSISVEVIVVDQTKKHTEQTDAFLAARSEDIILVKLEKANLPNARNVGIKKSQGDIIVFIDDDVLLCDSYLESILYEYQDSQIESVVGQIILKNYSGGNVLLNNSGFFKDWTKKILMFFFNRRKASKIISMGCILSDFEREEAGFSDGGRGCNMSFRKSVFDTIGYFDNNYIGNAMREETDLFCRMKAHKMKVWYSPKMKLFHLMENTGGCRSSKDEAAYWDIYFKNQIYFFVKNFRFNLGHIKRILILDIYKCKRKGIDIKALLDSSYERAISLLQNQS